MRQVYDHTDAAASPFSEWGRRKEAARCRTTDGGFPQSMSETEKREWTVALTKFCPIEGR